MVPARVLDPTLLAHSSYYLDALGLFPWLITEIPPYLHFVTLADRLDLGGLVRNYVISFILVITLWVPVRTTLYTAALIRRIT